MSENKLYIPTVISHSYFTLNGDATHIKEKEINYFYSLLYLFRNNIQKQSKVTLFLQKDQKSKMLNPEFKNFEVKIELLEFDDLGIVNNFTYTELKVFIEILSMMKININILKKNKSHNIKSIDIIGEFKFDKDNILHIKFTDNFVNLFLHTENYFKEVDLDLLIKINGYKSKRLYLAIKDYSTYKNQCVILSKEELTNIIGRIPSPKVFKDVVNSINEITTINDLKVEYPTASGRKLKEYRFEYEDLVKKNTSKSKRTIKSKEEIPKEIKDVVDKRIEKKIQNGEKIDDLDGYKQTSYKNELEKLSPQPLREKSDDDLKVEEWILNEISILKDSQSIQYTHYNYLMLCIEDENGKIDDYFIDDNYMIFNRIDIDKKNPITKSSELTISFFEYYKENIFSKVFCSYSSLHEDKTLSKF